jgi:hypothetical protein
MGAHTSTSVMASQIAATTMSTRTNAQMPWFVATRPNTCAIALSLSWPKSWAQHRLCKQ